MALWLLFILILYGTVLLSKAVSLTSIPETTLHIGSQAPDFSLPDEQGALHSLSALRGQKVALMFYPHPNTPGCTKEACSIRDKFSDLQKEGIVILGISKGSKTALKRFKERHNLTFPLLQATPEVLKNYGTTGTLWTFFWPKRVTFLIDQQGKIKAVITNVDLEHHADQVLKGFS